MSEVQLRKAISTDSEAILQLMIELGYNNSLEAVDRNLKTLINNDQDLVLVAESNKQIAGMIHASPMVRLTTPTFMEIVALCVGKDFQNQGIGTLLVEEVKKNAPDFEIRVRCNTKRIHAHQFYINRGFIEQKEQKVYKWNSK